jgi:sulfofructose kinase
MPAFNLYYAPAYEVKTTDTTGAGDVFHGAFCYAVLEGMPMLEALEFSNAMAAPIAWRLGREGIRAFMTSAPRRSRPEFAAGAAAVSK